MLTLNFFVMIIGISIGFKWEGIRKQKELDRISYTKLHIMNLEARYNLDTALELFDSYSDTKALRINLKKLNTSVANNVIEDENIFRLLKPYQISFIHAYLQGAQTLNEYNEQYNSYLLDVDYEITEKGGIFREKVTNECAGFIAGTHLLQGELKEYFDLELYDLSKIDSIEINIQSVKRKVLNRQFTTGK